MPERFTISEVSDADDWLSRVRAVREVEAVYIGEAGETQVYRWFCEGEELRDCGELEATVVERVRTMGVRDSGQEGEWMVLDSGAEGGQHVEAPNIHLEDAQKSQLQIHGMREAQVEFLRSFASEGAAGFCAQEDFVVSNVTNILISMGRLLKNGWTFDKVSLAEREQVGEQRHGQCAGVLVAPDEQCKVPVFYRRKSLAVLEPFIA